MRYLYPFAQLPPDQPLRVELARAAERLHGKLRGLATDRLDISDYGKRILGDQSQNICHLLQQYTYLLAWSIGGQAPDRADYVFVDYGGGTGILALLAKELGLGKVIYTDINEISCHDALTIARAMGLEADFYVSGEIDTLAAFLKNEGLSCQALASFDVIEHLHDIRHFFEKLSGLSGGPCRVVMATGANPLNPMVKRYLVQKHREAEYLDREKAWGNNPRDCHAAFIKVREKIIRDHAPQLGQAEISRLAAATRGMLAASIKLAAEQYLATRALPPEPGHPTNTCDPFTGNWAERLMDPFCLRDLVEQQGFTAHVLTGYYGRSQRSVWRRMAGVLLNGAISLLGKQGLRIAPFYAIYGERKT